MKFASLFGANYFKISGFAALILLAANLFFVFRAAPRPFLEQPAPDVQETADAARQMAGGNGYTTIIHEGERKPPRYPPGFSVALLPFYFTGDEYPANVQFGAKFWAAFYVVTIVCAAWLMGDSLAALIAALFVFASPFARDSATILMSDCFTAAFVIWLAVLLHYRPNSVRVAFAGVLAGLLICVRFQMILPLIAYLLVLPWRWKSRFVMFAAPFFILQAIINWQLYGSPLATGYNYYFPELQLFRFEQVFGLPAQSDGPWVFADFWRGKLTDWVCPCRDGGAQNSFSNFAFYLLLLTGLFWVYAPPFVTGFGIFAAWRKRENAAAQITLCLTGLSFVFFTFYYYQATRFMAATASLLLIYAALGLADLKKTVGKFSPDVEPVESLVA